MTWKKRFVALAYGLFILVLAACSPQGGPLPGTGAGETPDAAAPGTEIPGLPTEPPAAGDPLANTQWMLESVGEPGAETPVIEGTQITLEFGENGQAGGSGGCNSFSTRYEVQDGRLSFGPVASTKMACAGTGVMEQEQRYFQALQAAGEFELSGDRLVIRSENGQETLNFVKTQAEIPQATPEAKVDLANTGWMLESFGPTGAVEPVLEGTTIKLNFESGGQAGGSGGCNSYGAQYEVQGSTISFGQITSTLMACMGEGIGEQEQRYFQALASTGEFELAGDHLAISYSDGQAVLNFVRVKAG